MQQSDKFICWQQTHTCILDKGLIVGPHIFSFSITIHFIYKNSDTIELLHCVTMLKDPFISMGCSTVELPMEIKGTFSIVT